MVHSHRDTRDVKADLAVVGGTLATVYLVALAGHGLANGLTVMRPTLIQAAPFAALLALSLATWSRRHYPLSGGELVALFVLWPFVYQGAVGTVMLEPQRYIDPLLASWDRQLLGHGPGPPSWPLGGPAEELASLLYLSFYAVVPASVLWLWHRRSPEHALRSSLAFLIAFAACAAAWLILPAGGYHLGGSPDGQPYGPFTAAVRFVYAGFPHYAAAFPSSHVALAAVAAGGLVMAGASRSWLLWMAGVVFATIYGQYHYAVDAPPGLLVGVAAVGLAWRGRAEPLGDKARRCLVDGLSWQPNPLISRLFGLDEPPQDS